MTECTCPYDPVTGVAERTSPGCPMHNPKRTSEECRRADDLDRRIEQHTSQFIQDECDLFGHPRDADGNCACGKYVGSVHARESRP